MGKYVDNPLYYNYISMWDASFLPVVTYGVFNLTTASMTYSNYFEEMCFDCSN